MLSHMIDMAHSQEPETREAEPIYPYGLSITLTTDELEKLGLDCNHDDCQVGNYLHLHALAEVTGIHKQDTGDGEKTMLNIQITHLAVEDEDAENQEADEEMGRFGSPY